LISLLSINNLISSLGESEIFSHTNIISDQGLIVCLFFVIKYSNLGDLGIKNFT